MRGVANSAVDLVELLAHHLVEAGAVAEDFEQFADGRGEPFELAADLVAAERGQAVEAKLEDRLHLGFVTAVGRRPRPAARPPRPA